MVVIIWGFHFPILDESFSDIHLQMMLLSNVSLFSFQIMFRYTVGTVIGGILVATVMTGIVSFFVTAINTNTFPPIMHEWVRAWMLAWAIGTPGVIILSPIFRYIGIKFSDDPRDN